MVDETEFDIMDADHESRLMDRDPRRVPSSTSPACSPAKRVGKQTAKDIATSFFYWWYNQTGTNTHQGFDEWWDKVYSKKHFIEDDCR